MVTYMVKKSSALMEPKAHHHVNKSSPLACILGQINRVSTVHSYILNFCLDFILPSMLRPTKWSLSLRFFHQNSYAFSLSPIPHAGPENYITISMNCTLHQTLLE